MVSIQQSSKITMNKFEVKINLLLYFVVNFMIIMVILVFFMVISVNRRLFRYFGYFGTSSYRNFRAVGVFGYPQDKFAFSVLLCVCSLENAS